MPKFYEEAAHLLLVIATQGLAIAPGTHHGAALHQIALLIEQCLAERPTHADAATRILDALTTNGFASFQAEQRKRLIAITGTMIGNLMTVQRH